MNAKKENLILAIIGAVLSVAAIAFFVWLFTADQTFVAEDSSSRKEYSENTEKTNIKTKAKQQQEKAEIEPRPEQDQNEITTADLSPKETVSEIVSAKQVLLDVPFTPQAPFGNWEDIRQQNACEEASVLMVMRWVEGKSLTLEEAEKEIIAMADYEKERYGHFHDTSAQDTMTRLFNDYFSYNKVSVKYGIGAEDIKKELADGNLVIVPADGTKLGNPYYTPPGPELHMLVISGYDDDAGEFITNDPGTKRGEGYRYDYEVLENALRDYPSGYKEPMNQTQTAMIIIRK